MKPWEMHRFRPSEYQEMVDRLNKRAKAAEKQRRELEARH